MPKKRELGGVPHGTMREVFAVSFIKEKAVL
jgi:hypothetical protein